MITYESMERKYIQTLLLANPSDIAEARQEMLDFVSNFETGHPSPESLLEGIELKATAIQSVHYYLSDDVQSDVTQALLDYYDSLIVYLSSLIVGPLDSEVKEQLKQDEANTYYKLKNLVSGSGLPAPELRLTIDQLKSLVSNILQADYLEPAGTEDLVEAKELYLKTYESKVTDLHYYNEAKYNLLLALESSGLKDSPDQYIAKLKNLRGVHA